MAKSHRQFVCNACGSVQARWMGKCPDCGEWNALDERVVENAAADLHRPELIESESTPTPLREIRTETAVRWSTGLTEFDRVLGGGLVAGSAVLVGGDPGIGKSTLAMQAARCLAAAGRTTIYFTSEESPGQVRLRAERLQLEGTQTATDSADASRKRPAAARIAGSPAGIASATRSYTGGDDSSDAAQSKRGSAGASPSHAAASRDRNSPSRASAADHVGDVLVSAQSNLDVVLNQIRLNKPHVVIVDSIQMVYRPDLPSVPGSATQLRDCASRLVWLAKQMGFALVLVGHVTKEGAIAGPKVLEHIVDCVIYFEGERFHSHRLIRAVKNRFGSTDELGIFEMTDRGLIPVDDPSKLFVGQTQASRPGSVILAAAEGTRVLMVEVQALCVQSVLGAAKRKATGVDAARVAMILAVIEKHTGHVLGDQDVFVNIVGGVKIVEPAADLAIALAVIGAMANKALPAGTAVFGELGLGGEVRPVHHARRRIAEAMRIGMSGILAPRDERTDDRARREIRDPQSTIRHCNALHNAIEHLT